MQLMPLEKTFCCHAAALEYHAISFQIMVEVEFRK